jgi:hypothetical protein
MNQFQTSGDQVPLMTDDSKYESIVARSPVALTAGQIEVVQQTVAFLRSSSPVLVLQGYAGTGKTHLIGLFAAELALRRRQCVLMAPTGRAARVLSAKTGFPATTVHSAMYTFSGELVGDQDEDPDLAWSFVLKSNGDSVDAVYFIDESSMVSDTASESEMLRFGSGRLLTDLMEFIGLAGHLGVAENRRKVIFVGDPAQLPPVNASTSPALDPSYLMNEFRVPVALARLTEVVRQVAGSQILGNASTIRSRITSKVYNRFTIAPGADVELSGDGMINFWFERIHSMGSENLLAITHSNAQALDHNKIMRIMIHGIHSPEILVGDRLIVNANNSLYHLSNGDFAEVVAILGPAESRDIMLKGHADPVTLRFREVGIRVDGASDTVTYCKILENLLWNGDARLTRQEIAALRVDFEGRSRLRYPPKRVRTEDPHRYNVERERYLAELRSDSYLNALQVKFGFAVTCHKAQGGEWPEVFVDFRGFQGIQNEFFFRWAYTAITRAKSRLFAVYPPSISPWNKLSPTSPPFPSVPRTSDLTSEKVKPLLPVAAHMQAAGTLSDLPARIRATVDRYLIDAPIRISLIKSMPYRERYTFQRDAESADVDIVYKADGSLKVALVRTNAGGLGADLLRFLAEMAACIPVQEEIRDADFPEVFIREWYHLLRTHLRDEGIEILSVRHLKYRERYAFTDGTSVIHIDFHYDGGGTFTGYTQTNLDVTAEGLRSAVEGCIQRLSEEEHL